MPIIDHLYATLGDPAAPLVLPRVTAWADDELIGTQRILAQLRRRVEAVSAVVAGEIAHRSRRELGHTGLAASQGVRSAEELIATVTGTSRREARTLVKTAELLPVEPARLPVDAPPTPAWLQVLGDAVAGAALSAEAADVIRTRLAATSNADLAPEERTAREAALAEAATRLVAEAAGLTIEDLAVRAARVRDMLDVAGIPAREQTLHRKRYLKLVKQLDGTTRLHGLLDPESAAIVVPILDAATSPRRGGPRFTDPDAIQRAEDLMNDRRTTEQLTLDVLVELVRIGAQVDDGTLLGDRKPAVRILVTKTDLEDPARQGAAFFEGQTDAVSIQTAERYICAGGAVPVLFDGDGRVLNLGREQRLFSEKQRVALAARDGGCLMCGAAPSWCEAHHIDHWDEHHGLTNVDDGILLCRFCHLTLHNQRWRIRRHHGDYRLEHPDPDGTLRSTPLPSRSPARHRLLSTA
ncbi:MAG: DUF222 domain-containing protein [Protaetiibacter sp.]